MIEGLGLNNNQLMKIYTKTGDDGTTGLFGGERLPKDHLRIESYGTVDELNSLIGYARSIGGLPAEHDQLLGKIQEGLFVLGADLATPERKERANIPIPRVISEDVACLESFIDRIEEGLLPLKNFILPGGSQTGALLHLARTVARRAERYVVSLYREDPAIGKIPMQYLNRLSDLLFVLARAVNSRAEVEEYPWIPQKEEKSDSDTCR